MTPKWAAIPVEEPGAPTILVAAPRMIQRDSPPLSPSQSKAMMPENGSVVNVAGPGRPPSIYAAVTFSSGNLRTYLKQQLISRDRDREKPLSAGPAQSPLSAIGSATPCSIL